MARVIVEPNFLGNSVTPGSKEGGGTVPSGEWTGFAIGPGSDVDRCLVNGVPLGVGGVLPMKVAGTVTLTPIGGRPRSTTDPTGKLLEIIAFECGDHVAPIGLRAPRTTADRRDMNGTAAYSATPIIKAAFAGRRAGKLVLYCATAATAFDYLVKGVSYPPRPFDLNDSAAHSVDIASGTYTSAAASVTGNMGEVVYIGGSDNFDSFDEIHVHVRYPAGAGSRMLNTWLEVYDSAEGF